MAILRSIIRMSEGRSRPRLLTKNEWTIQALPVGGAFYFSTCIPSSIPRTGNSHPA